MCGERRLRDTAPCVNAHGLLYHGHLAEGSQLRVRPCSRKQSRIGVEELDRRYQGYGGDRGVVHCWRLSA